MGQSFTTGSGTFSLTDLDLELAAVQPGDAGSLVVTLMSDGGNGPGTLDATLGTIQDSALSSALASYDLELSSPIVLAADTEYWIDVAGSSSSAEWSYSAATSGTGIAGTYTYNNYNDNGDPGIADITAGGLYQMCVSDTEQACAPNAGSSGGGGSSGNTGGSSPPAPPGTTPPPYIPPPPATAGPPTLASTAAPEPAALGLLATGLMLLGLVRRSRRGSMLVGPPDRSACCLASQAMALT